MVLSQITPTPLEVQTQEHVIRDLTVALERRATQIGREYSFIEPQGSTGRKQTQLRGAADIDLFVGLSPENHPFMEEEDSDKKHELLDDLMNTLVDTWFIPAASALGANGMQKTYSQHPYLSLEMQGLEVDVLACFDLSLEEIAANGPITAVDRTIHHTNYAADRLTPELRNTVRLLKSFARACHAYGDRCAVGQMGLTGVSLEILAILKESFDDALERLYRLDIEPVDYIGRSETELRRKPAFKDDHIILIDPTDPKRNIASSFTERAYRWVKHRIDELRTASLKKNQVAMIDLMIESPIPVDPLPSAVSSHSVSREFKATGNVHYTILRDKLYSFTRRIQADLRNERTGEPRFGEVITEVYFEGKRYAVGFLVERPEVEPEFLRRGPPTSLKDACRKFLKAHPHAFEEDDHLWVREKREWVRVSEMIGHIVREGHIKGLEAIDEHSDVSKRVLNVLHRFILQIEPSFRQKITKVKDSAD